MLESYVGVKVEIRRKRRLVMWWLSLYQVCLEEEDGVIRHVHSQDIDIMKNEEMLCKIKMSHLEEITCLMLAIQMKIMNMWRHSPKEEVSPIGWGSNLHVFTKQVQSRKSSILRWTRSSSSSSSGICSRQRYDLDRVCLLPVSWC